MKIALINVPLRDPCNSQEWIPLPPKGYGGIQWVVTNLLEGFLDLGHSVWLLGAPSTKITHSRLTIVNAADPSEIATWLKTQIVALKIDVIHDHSNGVFYNEHFKIDCPVVATHHLTGKPNKSDFPVYLSYAQREQAGDPKAPVIRIPVNTKHYLYSEKKEDYLLYLGRVSEWKGVYEAAFLASCVGLKLIIAGPAWEREYQNKIISSFGKNVEFIGEVGGQRRVELLTRARAVVALSKPVQSPWGDHWCEPGATVVSEAAASGTPLIASTNGCLKEIVPKVGIVFDENETLTAPEYNKALAKLPAPPVIFTNCIKEWHYLKIASEYLRLFQEITKLKQIAEPTLCPIDQIKSQLLIEGGTTVKSILNSEMLTKLDQISRDLIKGWKTNKDQDKDFWWYREEKLKKNILYRIHRLETKDPAFQKIIDLPAIQELRYLIFGKSTKATACALVYKAPKGSASVPYHRDPIETPPNTIYNFSIYLDESDPLNGALEIVPGSHLDRAFSPGEQPKNIKILSAKPGDVTIHDVCVYHGSAGSLDKRRRRSIIIEFQPI